MTSRGLLHELHHPEVTELIPALSTFDDWLFMRDPEGFTVHTKLHQLLKSEPITDSREVTFLWRQLRPLTLLGFEKFWKLVDEKESLIIDVDEAYYDVWEEEGAQVFGMRHR